MDLSLSDEEKQIRRAARELAEEHFAENAAQWQGEYPAENAAVLADHGYLGMSLPSEYGGMDASYFETVMAMEGIGSVCPDTAALLVTTNTGNLQIIAKFAEEQYKEQYLPPVCKGEPAPKVAMSEPEVGSSVRDLSTEAEDDGDAYIVNGRKAWVSGAPKAPAFVTYVRFPDGNIGSMLIDRDTPGVSVQEPDINMYGGEQCQIFYEDARVSKDRVLVSGRDGFKRAITTYNANRVFGMARGWVYAKWLFEEALEYAQQREQGGNPIIEYQAVSHRLADMAIKLETSRWLIYRALSGEELPGRALSCMTKAYASQTNHEVADAALQIKGATGYVGDTPEAYAYQRLRGSQIAGGTPDIHRNNIMKALLKDGYPEVE